MLQIHTFPNTVELERLYREGELPKSDIVGTARRYMDGKGRLLILLRDASTWDVRGVFVDIPDEDDPQHRCIYTIFTDLEKIDEEYFQAHLRNCRCRIAEVHVPSTTKLSGGMATWRIMRHRKQAVGELQRFKFIDANKLEKDIAVIAAHGETARLELHLSIPVRKADKDICKRLTEYGFVTRKYIYHVIP